MSFRPDLFSSRIIIPIGVVVVLLVAGVAMMINNEARLKKAEAQVYPHFRSLKKYPDALYLPKVEVLGPRGGPVNLRKDFKGRLMVLNVWATWCAPCVRELPELKLMSTARQLPGVVVVAVSIDLPKNVDKVLGFIQKFKVEDVAGYHDYNGRLQASLPIRDLPVTFIISPSGQVLYEITGEVRWANPDVVNFLAFLDSIY